MRARLATSVALVALLAMGTTGCAFITHQATTQPYSPSDGIGTTVGEVDVRNALLVTEDGETASLLINVINHSEFSVQLNIQYQDANNTKVDESVHVNANSVKSLGAVGESTLILRGIDAPAGSNFPVFFQYGDSTGKQLLLPVLLPTGEYAELAPSDQAAP